MIHTRTKTTARTITADPKRMIAMIVGAAMSMLLVAAPTARGQITKDIRTSPSPPVPPIQAFIKAQLTKLHGNDPKATHDAREALIAESVAPEASPAFLATYARELNTALLDAQKDPELRVRLNGAIAAARVSENIAPKLAEVGPPLASSIIAFMSDGSEAVSLWGLKGGKATLPRLVKQGNAQAMMAAVIAAAKKYPGNTTAAYEALGAAASDPKLIASLIGPIQELLTARVAAYQKGIPQDAAAELTAANFLVDSKWWAAQNKDQRLITQQLLLNLAAAAGQQATAPNITEDQRIQMNMIVGRCGASFVAIGYNDGVPELQQISKSIIAPPVRNPADVIAGNAKQLREIVLKARPELAGAAGTATNTKPATSKTSGG